jgi:myo-inositol-1(or 4)-monophosphatase
MDEIDTRFAFAQDLVLRAGELARGMWQSLGPAEAKSAIDFCTEADRAVERLIGAALAERFGDTVIGEEFGGEASDSVWVVDPIDGTSGYIHGTPRWCVSLAYLRRGTIELGLIYAPADGRRFLARRGQGATLNGRPIQVSGLRHGAAPVVEVGWSARRPLAAYTELLCRLTAAGMEFRRHGSGALGLAEVACGLTDGYVELHINAWDALAGILLVQEAGGVTNDFLAGNGLLAGNLLLAASPDIGPALTAMTAGLPTAEG